MISLSKTDTDMTRSRRIVEILKTVMCDELLTVPSGLFESKGRRFEFPAAAAPFSPASAVSGVSIRQSRRP